MKELRLSKDLALPLDAVTEKLAWLGRTGSGKTYGCKRFVEQSLRAGAQVLIVDTVGVWPGLRLGPKAFDVPVLGGLYGDVPLESTAGALVADLVVLRGTSLILDVSLMNDAERSRFMAAFGERFFMAKKKSKSAVHVVLEECQEVVPQNPQKGEERMLHEWTRIVKLGRNFGIGVSFISQRPQEVNKKALNQAECVFAFQLTGPHERKALAYWLSDRGAAKDAEKLDDILPTLERGAPHVWSPSWLKVSKVVKILPIDTLDTSETPKVGARAFEAKKLTPIDLDAIRTQMAETLERAKADDPKALRARIAELEKAAKGHRDAKPAKAPTGPRREDLATINALRKALERAMKIIVQINAEDFLKAEGVDAGEVQKAIDAATQRVTALLERKLDDRSRAVDKLRREAAGVLESLKALLDGDVAVDVTVARVAPVPASFSVKDAQGAKGRQAVAKPPRRSSSGPGDESLTPIERALLHAIVQHDRLSLKQAAIIAGYSTNSGSTAAAAGKLRATGLVEGGNDGMRATEAGIDAAGDVPALPSGPELAELWYRKLAPIEAAILKAAVEAHPNPVSLREAAEGAGYSTNSGSTAAAAGKLRTLALVTGGNSGMTANERLV